MGLLLLLLIGLLRVEPVLFIKSPEWSLCCCDEAVEQVPCGRVGRWNFRCVGARVQTPLSRRTSVYEDYVFFNEEDFYIRTPFPSPG